MKSNSDLYDDIVPAYIRLMHADSPEAAVALQEIFALCGSRAVLRATLVISLLKMDVQKTRSVENIVFEADMMDKMKHFPEAWPLLEHAIRCCLQAWAVFLAEEQPWLGNGKPIADDNGPPLWHPQLLDLPRL